MLRFSKINQQLSQRFKNGERVSKLLIDKSKAIDKIIVALYQRHLPVASCIVAVGGYGRREMFPYSDIDILILVAEKNGLTEDIQGFVQAMWDIGVDIGHAVRTVQECCDFSKNDAVVATNLTEARYICGDRPLFNKLSQSIEQQTLVDPKLYFNAKLEEQKNRHKRYHHTAYRLEPNIKESPGGLRDLHTIIWISSYLFGNSSIASLSKLGLIRSNEYRRLLKCRRHLCSIRYALHTLTGKHEDRLLFQHQKDLSHHFGYKGDNFNQGVEKFMRDYYRNSQELSRINRLFLSYLDQNLETINREGSVNYAHRKYVNPNMSAVNHYLRIDNHNVFERKPWLLVDLFITLQEHDELKSLDVNTAREVFHFCHNANNHWRSNKFVNQRFLKLLQINHSKSLRPSNSLSKSLTSMHNLGFLSAYLPAFKKICGLMQFDLFHIYTVDAHLLQVLYNVEQFASEKAKKSFPLAHQLFGQLDKPELLYLGALFHDISKGQGGDHSELGAHETKLFSEQLGLPSHDINLVSWLVEHHLTMSVTAQRSDISDPRIIADFAQIVGDQKHLDYLYLLTVADICGTNRTLWNDWRDALLRTLYYATTHALKLGWEKPPDLKQLRSDKQRRTSAILKLLDPIAEANTSLWWQHLDDEYFLRHSVEEIAWHTHTLIPVLNKKQAPLDQANQVPLIICRNTQKGTEIFVHCEDKRHLFAAICSMLDQQNLSIMDARIMTSRYGFSLDSFIVLDAHSQSVLDRRQLVEVQQALQQGTANPKSCRRVVDRLKNRALDAFMIPTEITFNDAPYNDKQTVIEVNTADKPGLLAKIGWQLSDLAIRIHTAKIATYGERAEDIFFTSTKNSEAIAEADFDNIRLRLVAAING